jgi:tRNA(Arg) A34 adenosine deaminase TadA
MERFAGLLALLVVGLFAAQPAVLADDFDGMTLLITLSGAPGSVSLDWTGGQPTFGVYRSPSKSSIVDPANLIGTTDGRTFGDTPPAGAVFYYEITSPCVYNPPETCNAIDDDCDGAVDGPGSEATCNLPYASPQCVTGACAIAACNSGYGDCDGSPANGCETPLDRFTDCSAWLAAMDEREGIFSLLAYAVVYVDWQPDSSSRGYNIGAVLTDENDSIDYWSRNCVRASDFTHHAEAVSMQGFLAATAQGGLAGYSIYTTLEPCPMCAGMSTVAFIARAVHGQSDPRFGGDYAALRAAGRSTPTPAPSKLHYRDDLDRLYQQSGFTSIVSFLYSNTARNVFQAAYNDLLTFVPQYQENAAALQQSRDLLVDVQAGYANACHP